MLAIISCNAQLLSVHSFIFIVIVSCLFPFVTTYFGFSPFFVGFYVFFFHNDSFSSFSLNFISINSIFGFLRPFLFLRTVRIFAHRLQALSKRLSNFVENFLLCFPYYPLHFLLVCFRIVLQNLYSSTCAADIPFLQEHVGCFCCDTEYRLLSRCRYSERIFYARKI